MAAEKIAHVFKDGDAVIVSGEATKPGGDKLPQAGKRGIVINVPRPGRYVVDVPGMPVVNLAGEFLLPAPALAAGSVNIPAAAAAEPPALSGGYGFDVLQLELIVPSLTNPRTWFDPGALQELADSIASIGLGQPILVRPLPGSRAGETFADRRKGAPLPTHEIVAGERRYRACGLAGVRTVPVMIRNLDEEQVLRMQLIENVQREGLHPLEEARGYRRILDLPAYADQPMKARVEALAQEIKKSERYVYVTLQLLKLCDFTQQVFTQTDILHVSVARQIATIASEAQQIEATQRIGGIRRDKKGGWEVTGDAMPQRQAAAYVRDNYRLLLSKAPFPIKVEFAGIAACTGCAHMSANAALLFDEGEKVPDTCMDPTCYGKKHGAHTKQLAEAAQAKGQRVITGKEAKKLLPYENDPKYIAGSEYERLDEERYGLVGSANGKKISQILGKDAPAPVLIERPDGRGFIEALPTKDVDKLLKERGLLREHTNAGSGNSHDDAKKVLREKEYRWTLATELLSAVDAHPRQDSLCSHLLLPIALRLWARLDNDSSKRLRKLLSWTTNTPPTSHAAQVKFFRAFTPLEFNRFVVAACVAGELHYALHWHPATDSMDDIADMLNVDAKGIRSNLDAAAKAEAKQKADRAKGKASPAPAKGGKAKGPNQAFMAALYASPQLAVIVGSEPIPRTEIVSKVWAYIKKNKLQDATNNRMINADEKLTAVFGKKQASIFEMAGLLGKSVQNKPWPGAAVVKSEPAVKPAAKDGAQAIYSALQAAAELKGKNGPTKDVIDELTRKGVKTLAEMAAMNVDDLAAIACLTPKDAAAVLAKAKGNKKPGKAKPAEEQLGLELPSATPANPALSAWPFPIGKETLQQAQERAAAASKAGTGAQT